MDGSGGRVDEAESPGDGEGARFLLASLLTVGPEASSELTLPSLSEYSTRGILPRCSSAHVLSTLNKESHFVQGLLLPYLYPESPDLTLILDLEVPQSLRVERAGSR